MTSISSTYSATAAPVAALAVAPATASPIGGTEQPAGSPTGAYAYARATATATASAAAASGAAAIATAAPASGTPAAPQQSGSQLVAAALSRAQATVGASATGGGDEQDKPFWDGVTLARPLEAIPTMLTNLAEKVSGKHDERVGRALSQLLMAGQQLIQAGLRSAAEGEGAIAAGSSVLGKVLPMVGIGMGVMQVWKGWNELQDHSAGPLSIIHSKTGRSGLISIAAGALLFVPGVGAALGGALMRLAGAANEMDEFSNLDWATTPVEEQGNTTKARILHPFDRTPTTSADDATIADRIQAAKDAKQQERDGADPLGRVLIWARDQFES